MEAARPVQMVVTGAPTMRTVSKMANPSVIDPPGVLMKNLIAFLLSSPSRYRSWAMMRSALSGITGSESRIVRCSSRRSKRCL